MSQALSVFLQRLASILPYFLLGGFFLSPILTPLQQLLPLFILVFLLKSFVEVVRRE